MNKSFYATAIFAGALASSPALASEGDWTGPYVGVYGGANGGSTSVQDYWCWSACKVPVLDQVDPAFGATAGFNAQIDRSLLLGVEADIGSGYKRVRNVPGLSASGPGYVWTANLKRQSTIRARVGVVVKNTVLFATAGLALAKADLSVTADGAQSHGSSSTQDWGASWHGTAKGYAVGGGVEHSFGKVSAKLEYLRSDYASHQKCYMDLTGPNANTCWHPAINPWYAQSTVTFKPTVDSVRVGVNYRF